MSAHAIAIYILYVLWWPLNAPSRFGFRCMRTSTVIPSRLSRSTIALCGRDIGSGGTISIGLVLTSLSTSRAAPDRRGAMCIRRVVPVEFGGVRFSSARQAVWNDDRIACRIVSNLIVTKTKLGVTN